MLFYSHLVIAHKFEELFKPQDRAAYYTGSIIPDIRYFTDLPREQTHLELNEILNLKKSFPEEESFLDGFFLHCLIDEKDTHNILFSIYPNCLLRDILPRSFAVVIIELYFMKKYHLEIKLSDKGNRFLNEIGITDKQLSEYTAEMNKFIKTPGFEAGLESVKNLGLFSKKGTQKYLKKARFLDRHKLFQKFLFKLFRLKKIEKIIEEKLTTHINKIE